jgi:hypothetical protein
MYFNVFECIYQHYNWSFTITFSLYSFCHAHPPTHFFFTLHNDSLSNILYHYTLLFPFPLIHFSFHTIYEKITYQSSFFTFIHHPTFHIPCHCWLREAKQSPSFCFNTLIDLLYKVSL